MQGASGLRRRPQKVLLAAAAAGRPPLVHADPRFCPPRRSQGGPVLWLYRMIYYARMTGILFMPVSAEHNRH